MGSTPSLLRKYWRNYGNLPDGYRVNPSGGSIPPTSTIIVVSKCINNLAHWYSDCAAASKPAETGLIPVWATMGIYSRKYKKY